MVGLFFALFNFCLAFRLYHIVEYYEMYSCVW